MNNALLRSHLVIDIALTALCNIIRRESCCHIFSASFCALICNAVSINHRESITCALFVDAETVATLTLIGARF